jgi:hypothetical protein
MSSDLLAEFDSFYRSPLKTRTSQAQIPSDFSRSHKGDEHPGRDAGLSQSQGPPGESSDIWGGMTAFQPLANYPPASSKQSNTWGSFPDLGPQSTASFSKPTTSRLSAATSVPVGDVLFDALDALSSKKEEDDDFGEFETVTTESPFPEPPPQSMFSASSTEPKPMNRSKDLQSIYQLPDNDALPYPQAPLSFQERNLLANLCLSTKQVSAMRSSDKPKSASPVTAWPSFEPEIPKQDQYKPSPTQGRQVDDEWGDFSDFPPETPAEECTKAPFGVGEGSWGWGSVDQGTDTGTVKVSAGPPTNIPPPSVLLSLFPPLFDLPQSALFKPVANQPFSLKNRIISDPSAIEFLRAYLQIATVAARIISGRKLRWKRDTLLSQAMKIGPAPAHGKGGMKLAGVNKAEITREEREAADVVRLWKDQLGRLRSAIAVANSSVEDPSKHLSIPDVSEAMHIKTQQGGLAAPKPCIICGLRREERINKVDVDVDDSFGEWWVDHCGHRACKFQLLV